MSDELDFLLTDDLSAPIPARELSLERGYGLRPYQADAIRSVEDGWGDQEVKAQLICAATGTGKTAIIAILAQRTAEKDGKSLVLAHTDELIDQAIDKIRKFTKVKASKEKAHSYASRFDKMVVGSVQTLSRDMRLLTWPKKHFTTVIVDEAHRSLAASYQKVLQHFLAGGAKIIGVTATADRGDKRSLGEFFQRVAYEYGLLHAVRDGWLVRPIVKTMPLSIDLRGVHSKHTAAGTDFDSQEVGERLVPFMAAIAKQVKEARPSGKIVYFLPSVDTAQRMSDAVNAAGMTCDWVAGISEDRKSTLDRFKSGQLQAVCNCMLLTEGWDHDEVDTLVILRPTKIRSLFVQMAGRACRPLNPIVPLLNAAPNAFERLQLIKNSAKPAYTILDFLWLYEKHDLVRPASLISTKPEVVERMTGKDGDLMDLEEKAERDLLKKLEEEVKKNAKKQAKTIDPLAAAAELGDVDLATYVPETARDATPPSEAQLKILAQNGIKVEEVKYRGQASTLIGRILQRHAKGLCTIRQLHFLNQLGIDGAFMTRDQASAAISRRIKK